MALSLSLESTKSTAHIMTLHTISQLQEALAPLQEGTVIFVDVDDTLITPRSNLFRVVSPYSGLIDELKKNREKIPNFEIIISHWRLQRKTMLVAEGWPTLLHILKEKYPVYALTKMDTGSVGAISSMEKWRYDELTQKGLSFTPSFKGVFEKTLGCEGHFTSPSVFYHGIFMTGAATKGEVISTFFDDQGLQKVVLIDDREDYLQEVEDMCKKHAVPFLGILFRGVDLIKGTPDRVVADFQTQYLLTHAEWLEDEIAAAKLREE